MLFFVSFFFNHSSRSWCFSTVTLRPHDPIGLILLRNLYLYHHSPVIPPTKILSFSSRVHFNCPLPQSEVAGWGRQNFLGTSFNFWISFFLNTFPIGEDSTREILAKLTLGMMRLEIALSEINCIVCEKQRDWGARIVFWGFFTETSIKSEAWGLFSRDSLVNS